MTGRPLAFTSRSGRLATVAILAIARVLGQPPHPSFDVAAVKASKAGPGGFAPARVTFEPGGQTFKATDVSLKELIRTVYDISDAQVIGGPPWAASDGFDIEAKAEHPVSQEELRLMLRDLLANRFNLTLVHEQKELTVSAIVVGRGPLKLQPGADRTAPPRISLRPRSTRAMSVQGQNVTLPFFATWLSGRLHRIVVDKTGLSGSFDFTVETAFDQDEVNDLNVSEREIMTHMFSDIVQTLGLAIQSQRARVEVFTIEGAQKPSEN